MRAKQRVVKKYFSAQVGRFNDTRNRFRSGALIIIVKVNRQSSVIRRCQNWHLIEINDRQSDINYHFAFFPVRSTQTTFAEPPKSTWCVVKLVRNQWPAPWRRDSPGRFSAWAASTTCLQQRAAHFLLAITSPTSFTGAGGFMWCIGFAGSWPMMRKPLSAGLRYNSLKSTRRAANAAGQRSLSLSPGERHLEARNIFMMPVINRALSVNLL